MRRVAITGMGVIAAPGANCKEFFSQLVEGRPAVRRIQNLEPAVVERLNCRIAAEVPAYDPEQHFTGKELDQLDRFSQFAIVAARPALAGAGLGAFPPGPAPRGGGCLG